MSWIVTGMSAVAGVGGDVEEIFGALWRAGTRGPSCGDSTGRGSGRGTPDRKIDVV